MNVNTEVALGIAALLAAAFSFAIYCDGPQRKPHRGLGHGQWCSDNDCDCQFYSAGAGPYSARAKPGVKDA